VIERLARLVEGLVLTGGDEQPTDMRTKIDIIARALDLLRREKRHLDNHLPLAEFLQRGIDVVDNALVYPSPDRGSSPPEWVHPIRFQPPLLVLLLIHHRRSHPVYSLIEALIHTLWDSLGPLDFERTRTGVIRCFTNTRFAALVLRDCGLLKSTRKEAYKTWVLSLPGFAVGSELLLSPDRLGLGPPAERLTRELHPKIRDALGCLHDYEAFVRALVRICRPNVSLFQTFRPSLKEAHVLLDEYRAALQATSLGHRQRLERTQSCIDRLERLPGIEEFYRELSLSMLLRLPTDTHATGPQPSLGAP